MTQFQSVKRNRRVAQSVMREWKRWIIETKKYNRLETAVLMRLGKKRLRFVLDSWTRAIGIQNDEKMRKKVAMSHERFLQRNIMRRWRRLYREHVLARRKCADAAFISWKAYHSYKLVHINQNSKNKF